MQDKPASRRFSSPHHASPRTQLLSNGTYSVLVTAAGSGYSRWRDVAVTRWREDPVCDAWGAYVFVRDVKGGNVWSAGYQPIGKEADSYEVTFDEHQVTITRTDGAIVTTTEIVVAADASAEVRRVSITNTDTRSHEIELTSYAEVVLATPDADSAHPAFAKMFVQTEFVPESGTLLATRRPREANERRLWAAHHSVLEGSAVGALQFESDRARFLGRGRQVRDAVSVTDARPLSNSAGTVLDPVLALRRRVRIEPGKTARVAFWSVVGAERDEVLALAGRFGRPEAFDEVRTAAETHSRTLRQPLGIDDAAAARFQVLANTVLYSDSSLRAGADALSRNTEGPGALWALGISGDLPLVVVRIAAPAELGFMEEILKAQEFWRIKYLAVDLVILDETTAAGAAGAREGIDRAVQAARARPRTGTDRGDIHVLHGEKVTAAAREVLCTAARAVLTAAAGDLGAQLSAVAPRLTDGRRQRRAAPRESHPETPRPPKGTEYFNGLGGFVAGGREYVTVLDEEQRTPAPWVNVIANAQFGCQVSTDGACSTWSLNAREYQLTPWSNDPVSDTPSEVIYVRDEATGELWSPTPLPFGRAVAPYVIRHGFGYTRFEHTSREVSLDLLQFVPLEDSLKISRLTLVNRSSGVRRLTLTHYVDWVLGNQRSRTAPFIITHREPTTGALFARNPWRSEFQSRTAFIDMRGRQQTVTGDRAEFIGRHGSLAEPAALLGEEPLSGRVGGGLDPCGALQSTVTLQPGETTELAFFLGEEASVEAATRLIERYRSLDLDAVFKSVTDYWDQGLGGLQVKTPERSMDILLNGWLLYQTQACRVWARTGFYQASGAYGYRDQLQDVMALCVARPHLTREHLLRAAARQFEAGDVQHWWLPTSGAGVKTRVSDDRIWLPFVAAHYVDVTGDVAVLDEVVPFLEGGPLKPDQHEIFNSPARTAHAATLFDHCVRALDSSLGIGSHGLPLFGAGDWNDGMNRVGAAGRGESVWLGWFLHTTLNRFAGVAEDRGEAAKASVWRKHAFALQQAIEREAWDGDWYRRGYYDDGAPLGSISSDECRIDAIAQSWAVISGAGDPAHTIRAMSSVDSQLVSRSDGLVKLFTPPFDHSRHDPGYIKGYPPGLRENGGQYTHAAMWTTLAFALMGNGDRAGELFSLLNPINHSSTRAGIHRYKVEPYVVCADVYSAEGRIGQGGWTWYTGSAGWMYRTAVEGILGIRVRPDALCLDPCIPHAWPGFEVTFKHGSSRYQIAVENPDGVCKGIVRASLDDREISHTDCVIKLIDDGSYHYARITLG